MKAAFATTLIAYRTTWTSSIKENPSVKAQAISTGRRSCSASGISSNSTRKIIAPAANPSRGTMRGSKNQTRRAAGTAAIGCGRLVRKAAVKQWRMLAPRARMGIDTARPSGTLWMATARAM